MSHSVNDPSPEVDQRLSTIDELAKIPGILAELCFGCRMKKETIAADETKRTALMALVAEFSERALVVGSSRAGLALRFLMSSAGPDASSDFSLPESVSARVVTLVQEGALRRACTALTQEPSV